MVDRLAWIHEQLAALAAEGVERSPSIRRTPQSPRSIRLGDAELLNFGSNDYLGLASDARLVEAAEESVAADGWGSGASPLLGGRSQEHALLEKELAEFLDCEAALAFPSGFAANVGCLTAITGDGDVVFSDALNHASIIDGCRLSRARVEVYAHRDTSDLRRRLSQSQDARRRLIVTDSLFSMHGDAAPLSELAPLASEFDAMLMIDEAHATGVFGECGRGLCEQSGVRPDIHVGTLSKALGSHGGFVAGRAELIQWLFNRARPYFFSTASPPATAAAARAALRIVRDEPQRRMRLLQLSKLLREGLQQQGWSTGASTTQIIPIMVGDSGRAMGLSQKLRDAGVFAPGIRPPSVPQGEALVRISVSAAHCDEDIQRLLQVVGQRS